MDLQSIISKIKSSKSATEGQKEYAKVCEAILQSSREGRAIIPLLDRFGEVWNGLSEKEKEELNRDGYER